LFCPGYVTHEKFYSVTGYKHSLTECIMFIHITDIKEKHCSEYFALSQGITNHKSNKRAVVDNDAATNSIFTVSFSMSFMS